MELNNQYIGSFIKFMRQRAGLTQQELAERIGVGSKTISKWEQGRGIPDISLLYSLSLELDVDIESLLAGNLEDIAGTPIHPPSLPHPTAFHLVSHHASLTVYFHSLNT